MRLLLLGMIVPVAMITGCTMGSPRNDAPIGATAPAKRGMTFFKGRLGVVSVTASGQPVEYRIQLRNRTRSNLKFAYVVAHFDEQGRRWLEGIRDFKTMTLPPGGAGTIEGKSPFDNTIAVGLEARPTK